LINWFVNVHSDLILNNCDINLIFMSTRIAQITASIILVLSIISILFGSALGVGDLSGEAFAFLGVITGASTTFLFLAKTKNNGTLVNTRDAD